MGQNALIIQHPLHQHFNLAATGLTTEQTRRDHPGVVKHQQIAGIELIEDVGEGAMRQRARRPVQGEQATATALRHRIVGDQRFG